MHVVDTNVLVYAADASAPEHARCRALLESWRGGKLPWFTTWSVLYELVRVVTHPRVLRRPWTAPRAWEFVDALLASPSIGVLVETSRHGELAALTFAEVPFAAGNLVFDARTAILMREHGIRRIYTRDTDFARFPFVEMIDPLVTP